MEDLFLAAIKIVNPIQLGIIILVIFYFYNRTDQKIEKLELKIEKLDQKIENIRTELSQKIENIRTEFNQRIDNLYQLILNVFNKAA